MVPVYQTVGAGPPGKNGNSIAGWPSLAGRRCRWCTCGSCVVFLFVTLFTVLYVKLRDMLNK